MPLHSRSYYMFTRQVVASDQGETAKQVKAKRSGTKAASFLLPVSHAALVPYPSFAPVSLAPMGRLGFPTQQQPRRFSDDSITNECDERIKIWFVTECSPASAVLFSRKACPHYGVPRLRSHSSST
jgi:hypothetical protein